MRESKLTEDRMKTVHGLASFNSGKKFGPSARRSSDYLGVTTNGTRSKEENIFSSRSGATVTEVVSMRLINETMKLEWL